MAVGFFCFPGPDQRTLADPCHGLHLAVGLNGVQKFNCMLQLTSSVFSWSALTVAWILFRPRFSCLGVFHDHAYFVLCEGLSDDLIDNKSVRISINARQNIQVVDLIQNPKVLCRNGFLHTENVPHTPSTQASMYTSQRIEVAYASKACAERLLGDNRNRSGICTALCQLKRIFHRSISTLILDRPFKYISGLICFPYSEHPRQALNL